MSRWSFLTIGLEIQFDKFLFAVHFTCANYTIKPVNNSTATLARNEKSPNRFSARTSSLNRKSIPFLQFLWPVPCKHSSDVLFHRVFGFQLFCHTVLLCQLRHDQLHAASCRFVDLGAILFYGHRPIYALGFSFTWKSNTKNKE